MQEHPQETPTNGNDPDPLTLKVDSLVKDAIERRLAPVWVRLPEPGKDGDIPTQKHSLFEIRQFYSPAEQKEMQKALVRAWPHISPGSTLVAAIGNHYAPGVWNCLTDMVKFTNESGIRCGFSEIPTRP